MVILGMAMSPENAPIALTLNQQFGLVKPINRSGLIAIWISQM
jgi:hypothetical protein